MVGNFRHRLVRSICYGKKYKKMDTLICMLGKSPMFLSSLALVAGLRNKMKPK